MKTKLILILTVTSLLILSPTFGQWEYHLIDSLESYIATVTAGDIDNDGDNDLLVMAWTRNMVLLYLNNNSTWTKVTVDSNLICALAVDIADLDKDGNLDIIATPEYEDVIVWYKNEGGDYINWVKDTIGIFGSTITWTEDINGDGAMDVVVNRYMQGGIFWYENNLPTGWISHFIGSNHCSDFRVVDINKDGKPDIVGGNEDLKNVELYKNNLPDTNWTEIIIDDNINNSNSVCAGDIDNDDDIDVAIVSNVGIIWYEQDGTELTWIKHAISTDVVNARYVDMADADNNGYMDVVTSDLGANEIVLFKNEDSGQNWTEIVIDDNYSKPNGIWFADVDLDGDFDITPSTQNANLLVWYENHSYGTAYPESLEISPFSVQSVEDTIIVTCRISNPENHSVSAFAVIQGEQFTFIDTLQLFDDGLHHDGDASDNIWGNIILNEGLSEDSYNVDLFTYDSIFDVQFDYFPSGKLITFGPVSVSDYSFSGNDIEPNPGDNIRLELELNNNGSEATATNIIATLIPNDPLISVPGNNKSFENILPGESSISNSLYSINISEECPVNKDIPIQVNISSFGYLCWIDTLYLQVQEPPVNIKETNESIIKIYPNPSNDMIFLETESTAEGIIEIYDITGKKLFSRTIQSNKERIDVSGLDEGIYILKLRMADAIITRKITIN